MSVGHPHIETSRGKLALTILLNAVITLAEFIGGLVSGYLALLADAVHNLSDVAALVLAWLGVIGAQRPATKTSTYGLKRVEVMTALISAVSLVVIAIFIFREAYYRLINPQALSHPVIFLSVACIGLLGNLLSVWFLASERGKSLNMKAAFLHMAYDTASSVAVIIGGIVILVTGWTIIDVILSALIGLAILWSSFSVIKEATMILLESVPANIDFDQVHSAIAALEGVKDVHDLHIWSLSSHQIALSCHVCVEQNDLRLNGELVGKVNALLLQRFGIDHCTIQLECLDCERADLLCNHQHHRSH